MAKFLLTYHGEMADFADDPETIAALNARWGEWYGSIGEGVVEPGNPVAGHTAVGADGDIAVPYAGLTGFTVISAASLEAATEIARQCPVLESGSTVQISALIDM